MARTAGRDQLKPMERLIRLLICLADGDRRGVPIGRLLRMADLTEDTEASRAQLRRDLAILRQGGWDIRNVAGDGEDGRYVLHARDNTLALLLTPGEIAALREVWAAASMDHAKPPPFVGRLHHAVRDRSLLSFGYDGRRRVVHPDALYSTGSGWVLLAREREADPPKEFVTAWIHELAVDEPGTASRVPELPAVRLDPMRWELDPPMRVRLAVPTPFVHDVLGLLPRAVIVSAGADDHDPDETLVELVVTNQATFRSRLYALGLRARVLEPPSLVDEIVTTLRAVAGSAR
ncbi:MAG TPA: WYL domain-containing protein [Microlunatus sp.]|nr:WYL domain-containing protein [Microlunatus sp.]